MLDRGRRLCHAFQVCDKTETNPVSTVGPSAVLSVVGQRTEQEYFSHPLIFTGIDGPKLMPVFGEMQIALHLVGEWHRPTLRILHRRLEEASETKGYCSLGKMP